MSTTATERSMQARVAGLTRWAKEPDRKAATAPARQGFHARFERQLDEMGVTDPAERAIRGAQLKRAYMTGLALKSAKARRVAAPSPRRPASPAPVAAAPGSSAAAPGSSAPAGDGSGGQVPDPPGLPAPDLREAA